MIKQKYLILFLLLSLSCDQKKNHEKSHENFRIDSYVFDNKEKRYVFKGENSSEFTFDFTPVRTDVKSVKALKLSCSISDDKIEVKEFYNDTLTFWNNRYGMMRTTPDFEIFVFRDTTLKSKPTNLRYIILESPFTSLSGDLMYKALHFEDMSPKAKAIKLWTSEPESSSHCYILNTTLFFDDEAYLDSIVVDKTIVEIQDILDNLNSYKNYHIKS